MAVGNAGGTQRQQRKPQIHPSVLFAGLSFGLGVIGALAFAIAGVSKEFAILGGTGVAIVVSLLQLRQAILSGERNSLGCVEEETRKLGTSLEQHAMTLTNTIKSLSAVRATVFRAERDTLSSATQLQEKAVTRISAMWTVMPYTPTLKSYLEESTLGFLQADPSKVIQRVVDLQNNPEDIVDHLRRTWEKVYLGQYEVAFANRIEIEMLIVDARHAALFLQPGRGYDCVHLEGTDPGFVDVVNSSFLQVWAKASGLPQEFAVEEPDWNSMRNWLAEEREKGSG